MILATFALLTTALEGKAEEEYPFDPSLCIEGASGMYTLKPLGEM